MHCLQRASYRSCVPHARTVQEATALTAWGLFLDLGYDSSASSRYMESYFINQCQRFLYFYLSVYYIQMTLLQTFSFGFIHQWFAIKEYSPQLLQTISTCHDLYGTNFKLLYQTAYYIISSSIKRSPDLWPGLECASGLDSSIWQFNDW